MSKTDMLTAEKILAAMAQVPPVPRFDNPFRLRPLSFAGMDVYEAPAQPVLQISPNFPYVSDEFRAKWNAWALERFGVREIVPMNVAFQFGNRLVVNPRTMVALINAT